MDTILKLRAAGYQVGINGDRIRYQLPDGTQESNWEAIAPILADLKARKEEALAFLQVEVLRPSPSPSDLLPDYPFAVGSRALGTEVWIVPDWWYEPVPGLAYTHAEVAALARQMPSPAALRAIHAVKTVLDGEILR